MGGVGWMPILIGVGVIAVVALAAMMIWTGGGEVAEQRLDDVINPSKSKARGGPTGDMLLRSAALDPDRPSFWTGRLPSLDDVAKTYEQADVNLPFESFMRIVVMLAVCGGVAGALLGVPKFIGIPAGAAMMGTLPFLWLRRRKRRRIEKFVAAMPEAVELLARALRAGQGLAAGISLINEEMTGPIAAEFGRVYYEQNLGVAIEVSLRNMAERVPSMDVPLPRHCHRHPARLGGRPGRGAREDWQAGPPAL